ncbi:glycosyl hydrolase [Lewinella sp. W8]|uniref:VPS10 domain-containing protein n=1 Tax=Lewinella sp. W8 TaxID=2528208 RepID=UPI001067D06B|nr:glycosyl hydrolase [Lewinella sp. W8]MTB50783.1 glycosyl hydrolase [Lewinella sp. W8]
MHRSLLLFVFLILGGQVLSAQNANSPSAPPAEEYFSPLKWRSIGPFRGGRSVASCGLPNDPLTAYMGTTGGGLWKTTDAGQHWVNVSDGYFKTGSVGAVAVAPSDVNVLYVGMGEHAPRGVMTSHGDGVYKSTDAGRSWKHLGLAATKHISRVIIHPNDPEVVYVAAQGALHGPSKERGVYKSMDGGEHWEKLLYVDQNTGAAHLSMDPTNPRVLYAAMWDHRRLPWQVISGGPGSGLYKSTDAGKTWKKIEEGLPDGLGKMSVSVSGANPDRVYALVEGDSQQEKGGLYVSENAGASWTRVSKEHRLVQRAWYYTEVFADPTDEHTVYVLNAPALKSIDGGKSWRPMTGTHGDHHDLWINPNNGNHLVLSNDGGAAISFDQGDTWSRQDNMPTAQFYRINVDNHFPYRIYAGQQDNSSVRINHRNPNGYRITDRDWEASAGGESAFLAFDPDDPRIVLGGSYQGTIEALDTKTGQSRQIMASPNQYLAMPSRDMRYRFNWNAPIIRDPHQANTFYHGGNKLLRTRDLGLSWEEVSPDLTRNEDQKQGLGGAPFTNEGAGGENYGTLSYVVASKKTPGEIWAGSDDGLVHLTRDGGKSWVNITPKGLPECLINAIELSPTQPGRAYLATTRYKFDDFRPGLYRTDNYGKSWEAINSGIPHDAFTRVVREDPARASLLFAGTETGLYLSTDGGSSWEPFQLNLPVTPITDLRIHRGDLIAATSGRSFWVLDDLETIRQYGGEPTELTLYDPAAVYRTASGSPLDGNTDKFDGAQALSGVNPAGGAVVYYHLPPAAEDGTLTMTITDEDGELVREFFSEGKSGFAAYPGGPGPDPTLSGQDGLNRFVWDLRHPTLLGAPKVYIEGSYRGRRVVPGRYTLTLRHTLGDKTTSSTSELRVLPHPDVDAAPAAYREQDTWMKKIAERINDIHGKVNQLQSTTERLQDRLPEVEEESIQKSAQDLLDRIESWDAKMVQRKSQSYDDVINFPNGLTADYFFLNGQMGTNVPNVTEAMKERWEALESSWKPYDQEYSAIKSAIDELDNRLRQVGVGPLK